MAEAGGIELKLKTGEVIKASTAEEALNIAVKMTEDTKDVYRTEKAAREQLESQVASLAAQVAAQNKPAPVQNGQFDKDRYYKILNEDPIHAQNYLDAHRFGLQEASQVPQYFTDMNQTISEVKQNMVAGSFLAQHAEDFPATVENARILTDRTQHLVGQGHPYNTDTVNMAYSQLISDGKIKPNEVKPAKEDEQPNPSLTGAGAAYEPSADDDAKMANMNDEQLRTYLRSKGVQGI